MRVAGGLAGAGGSPPGRLDRNCTGRLDRKRDRLSPGQARDGTAAGLGGGQVISRRRVARRGLRGPGRGPIPGAAAAEASLGEGQRSRWTPLRDPVGAAGAAPCAGVTQTESEADDCAWYSPLFAPQMLKGSYDRQTPSQHPGCVPDRPAKEGS